jgi:hypothetical protein
MMGYGRENASLFDLIANQALLARLTLLPHWVTLPVSVLSILTSSAASDSISCARRLAFRSILSQAVNGGRNLTRP